MKKYLLLIACSWQTYFAYRLNFFLWRLRNVLSFLMIFFLWQAIFQGRGGVFGYTKSQMFTYIFMLNLISSVVFSTQTSRVAEEINFGKLSHFLLLPFSYFGNIFSRDIADKMLNTTFSILEFILLFLIIRPPFVFQSQIMTWFFFLISVILSALLYFEISLLLSLIGFWSRETWAPRFIFFILITFLAGTYFPLDILPKPIYEIFQLLPFTYLVFFPIKIYIGGINTLFILKGFSIIVLWLLILWWVTQAVWKKGLKLYTAEGI